MDALRKAAIKDSRRLTRQAFYLFVIRSMKSVFVAILFGVLGLSLIFTGLMIAG